MVLTSTQRGRHHRQCARELLDPASLVLQHSMTRLTLLTLTYDFSVAVRSQVTDHLSLSISILLSMSIFLQLYTNPAVHISLSKSLSQVSLPSSSLPQRYYVMFGSLLSQIRLSSVFSNITSPFCTLAILWPPCKILRRSSQGNLSIGGVKHNTV